MKIFLELLALVSKGMRGGKYILYKVFELKWLLNCLSLSGTVPCIKEISYNLNAKEMVSTDNNNFFFL